MCRNEWSIPDERDQLEVPKRPDLRCKDHESVCAVVHELLNRVLGLEQRVRTLEGKS